jgi:ribonuclease P protein component
LNRKDFVNVNRWGKRDHTTHFTILCLGNRLGITRLGITVGRRIGNAVKRNRVKRLIREFYRLHKARFPQGYDIVIVAKKGADHLDFWKIEQELDAYFSDKNRRVLS